MGKIYFGDDGTQKKVAQVKNEPEKHLKPQKHKKNGGQHGYHQSFDADVKNLEKRWFEHVRSCFPIFGAHLMTLSLISVPQLQFA